MHRVLIVGCGQIAGGFDAHRAPSALPLTHAGAYVRHGGYRIVGCVEPDGAKRAAFMRRWHAERGFARLEDVVAAAEKGDTGPFDVVSLCSPTSAHAADIALALALEPRLLFCEKPVTKSAADTAEVVAACADAGVQLAVNHNRRWASDVQRLRRELAAGHWGAVRAAIGLYNKGILNNGSHLVDLLHLLLGPMAPETVQTAAPRRDHWPDDPSVSVLMLSRGGVPVTLNTGHAADGAVFELQLVTERGVVAIEDGGNRWRVRRMVESTQFAGYRAPDEGEIRPGAYASCMSAAVHNVAGALERGEALASTGDTALAAQRLCEWIACRAAASAGTQRAGEGGLASQPMPLAATAAPTANATSTTSPTSTASPASTALAARSAAAA